MLNFRPSLFRSPERDEETDRRRLALILRAVRLAVTSARDESDGLRRRLEKARRSAAFLLARIDEDAGEAAQRFELGSVEQQLLGAERRLAQLAVHLALLRRIEVVAASEPGPSRQEATPSATPAAGPAEPESR